MGTSIIQLFGSITINKDRNGSLAIKKLLLILCSFCLNGCPFIQTSIDVDCGKYNHKGRISVKYFAYFNGIQWESVPLPNISISSDFVDNRAVFADSVNRLFYYYHDFTRDYSSPRSLWSYSIDMRQWKLVVSGRDMSYFTVINGNIYFYSTDTVFTTEKGTIHGSGIMQYDGSTLKQLDTAIHGTTKEMFSSGNFLFFIQEYPKNNYELLRYSIAEKVLEKASSVFFYPQTDCRYVQRYYSAGRYIYYEITGQSSKIYRYDTLSKQSVEQMPNVKNFNFTFGRWIASDHFIFFSKAKFEHEGIIVSGSLIYDVQNDTLISLQAGLDSTLHNPNAISAFICDNNLLYYGGEIYSTNGTNVGGIAQFNITDRKTYALDGGVYRIYVDCNPLVIGGISRIGNKLFVFGQFDSAGIPQ